MKVVQITANIDKPMGGATIAAKRLNTELIKFGIDSSLLSNELSLVDISHKASEKLKISKFINTKVFSFFELYNRKLNAVSTKEVKFSSGLFSNYNTIDKIHEINPDIVHLHWYQNGLLSFNELSQLTKYKVFVTLHDMWSFTGGCFYSNGCEGFIDSCKKCPLIKNGKENQAPNLYFSRKKSQYAKANMHAIAPSKWMQSLANQSSIFKNNVLNIPNTLDIDKFSFLTPEEIKINKQKYGLDQKKKTILLVASNLGSRIKGSFFTNKLCEDSSLLSKNQILLIGKNNLPHKDGIVNLGSINSEKQLAAIYSISDVFIMPSLQENFANVALEAMSCRTPVICFQIGGNSDIVTHKKNGFIVESMNYEELKKGAEWCMEDCNLERISKSARDTVVQNFSPNIIVPKFISAYEEAIR